MTVKSKAIPIHKWEKAMKRLKDHNKECILPNGKGFSMFLYYLETLLKSKLKTYGTHRVCPLDIHTSHLPKLADQL